MLDEYKRERRKKMTGKSPSADDEGDKEDYMDAAMKNEDLLATERINAIIADHSKDMMNYVPHEQRRKFFGGRDREFHFEVCWKGPFF